MRRRMRRRVEWFPNTYINRASITAVGGIGVLAPPIVGSSDISTKLDGNGTLLRIIGDIAIDIDVSAAAAGSITVGIIRVQVDDTGAMPSTLSAQNTTGGSFSWLWTRTFYFRLANAGYALAPDAGNGNDVAAYPHPLVDVRVKRRLLTGNAIGFYWDTTQCPAQATAAHISLSLRALVSH